MYSLEVISPLGSGEGKGMFIFCRVFDIFCKRFIKEEMTGSTEDFSSSEVCWQLTSSR